MHGSEVITHVGESLTGLFRNKRRPLPFIPVIDCPVRFHYGPFQFQVTLPKGTEFQVEATSNLQTWQVIASEQSEQDTTVYVDPNAKNFSYRFYRVAAYSIYADKILGYVALNLPPGYSMISNPFRSTSHQIGVLLPEMPEQTALIKYDPVLTVLREDRMKSGKWTRPFETLAPGEGALFFNPTSDFLNLNFVGEIVEGSHCSPIPSGFSIRSSLLPKAGRLRADLGFPLDKGDVVHLFDRDTQKYVVSHYDEKQWETNEPVIGIGESFWIGKASAGNWIQQYKTG